MPPPHPLPPIDTDPAWTALADHAAELGPASLRELFAADPGRAETFTLEAAGLRVDLSKNLITARTIELLCDLAERAGVEAKRDAMFSGQAINVTGGQEMR